MGNMKSSEKETTTTITLDNALFKAVKHYAVEENKKIKDIVAESLKSYLQSKGVSITSE